MSIPRSGLAVLLLALAQLPTARAADALPGDSLYQLSIPLTTQAGQTTTLAQHRGHPVLISLFYASCGYTCPILVNGLQRLEQSLEGGHRARLRVLLVSLDPERDTPAALNRLAREKHIAPDRWTLARAEPAEVRKLAAALGIQYRRRDDGEISHSTQIILLSAEGRILARTGSPVNPEPEFRAALQGALAPR